MKKIIDNKKLTLAVLSILLVLCLSVGTTFAYLSAVTDQADNVFSFSENIRAGLTEPNWDEDDGIQLVPNKTTRKDPMITNTCDIDEYVAMKITFRYGENNCDDNTCTDLDRCGEIMSKADLLKLINLLEIDLSDEWVLCDGTLDEDNTGKITDITPTLMFYYKENLAPNKITAPLFSTVRVKDKNDKMTESDLRWLQSIKIEDGEIVHNPYGIYRFHIQIEGAAVQSSAFDNPASAIGDFKALFG